MVSEAPPFWWKEPDWRAWALYPLSKAYGSVARVLMEKAPRVPIEAPVICVGNFTVGGAGKTPTALALADAVVTAGLNPGFLSRGYGGSMRSATLVDPAHHNARDVGDEPILLASKAPTVVSSDRVEGAMMLTGHGVNFIILDDGFQSAAIKFDYALVVVDADRGIGNGHIIPSGPLRAPVVDQMRHATALLVIGEGSGADSVIRSAGRAAKPVFKAQLVVKEPEQFRDRKFLAFAAIGSPQKFFESVRSTGANVVEERSFGDHHVFTDDEIGDLLDRATNKDLELITTSKDMVRLRSGHGRSQDLVSKAAVLEVEMEMEQADAPGLIIAEALREFKKRRLGA